MTGYQDLLTYQQAEEIYDLTVQFCQRFLPGRENLRQRDQMIQTARSGKQNIVEGYSLKSLKGYIKLLGVSRASLEELLEDYKDFTRLRNIEVCQKDDPRFMKFGSKGSKGSTVKHKFPPSPYSPSDPCYPVNYLIRIINRTCYLLHRQIASLEQKFILEGGYTEKLFYQRIKQRKKSY